jgi:uncharacterized protein YndB with AHSA1/START domain
VTATRTDRGSTDTTTVYTEGSDLVMERTFDAPRELVWTILSDPERITHWWGPDGSTTTVEEMDMRPGGRWRFLQHAPDGNDYPFTGEYREIQPPERVVQTFIFDVEPFRDQVALETLTLEDLDGQTRVTNRTRFGSVEDLEGALASGMVGGALQAWDRLAAEMAKG